MATPAPKQSVPEAEPVSAAPSEPLASYLTISSREPSWIALRRNGNLEFQGTLVNDRTVDAPESVEIYAGRPDLVMVKRPSGEAAALDARRRRGFQSALLLLLPPEQPQHVRDHRPPRRRAEQGGGGHGGGPEREERERAGKWQRERQNCEAIGERECREGQGWRSSRSDCSEGHNRRHHY